MLLITLITSKKYYSTQSSPLLVAVDYARTIYPTILVWTGKSLKEGYGICVVIYWLTPPWIVIAPLTLVAVCDATVDWYGRLQLATDS
jgi:hypothetical protein